MSSQFTYKFRNDRSHLHFVLQGKIVTEYIKSKTISMVNYFQLEEFNKCSIKFIFYKCTLNLTCVENSLPMRAFVMDLQPDCIRQDFDRLAPIIVQLWTLSRL